MQQLGVCVGMPPSNIYYVSRTQILVSAISVAMMIQILYDNCDTIRNQNLKYEIRLNDGLILP